MERRRGVVVRREVPPQFGGGADPAQNRKLSEVMIDTLAEFHAVDYRRPSASRRSASRTASSRAR